MPVNDRPSKFRFPTNTPPVQSAPAAGYPRHAASLHEIGQGFDDGLAPGGRPITPPGQPLEPAAKLRGFGGPNPSPAPAPAPASPAGAPKWMATLHEIGQTFDDGLAPGGRPLPGPHDPQLRPAEPFKMRTGPTPAGPAPAAAPNALADAVTSAGPRSVPSTPPNAGGLRENTGLHRGFHLVTEPQPASPAGAPKALPAPAPATPVPPPTPTPVPPPTPTPGPAGGPSPATVGFADYAAGPVPPPAAAEAIPSVEAPAASLISRALNSEFTLGGAIKGAATAPFRGVKGGYGMAKAALTTPISAAGAGRAALGAAKGVGPMLALGAAADPEGTLHMLAHPLATAQAIPGAIGGELAGIANEPGFAAGASRVGSDLYAATLGPIVGAGWNLGHGARTWFDDPSRIGGDLAYAGNRIGEEFGAIDPVTERGKLAARDAKDGAFLDANGYTTPSPDQERAAKAAPPGEPGTPEGSVPTAADVMASIGTGRQATPGQAAASAPPPTPTPATAEGPPVTRGFESPATASVPVGADGQPAGPGWTPRVPASSLDWQPRTSPGSAEAFHSGRIPALSAQYQQASARVQAAEAAARGPDGQLVWSASEPPGGDPKLNAIREAFAARDGIMDQLNDARFLSEGADPEAERDRLRRSMPPTREMHGTQVSFSNGYAAPATPGGQGQVIHPVSGTDTVKPQANLERDAKVGLMNAQAEESRAKAEYDRSNVGQAGMKERILKNPADALTAAIVSGQDPEVASAGLARVEGMKRGMQEGPITDANAADRLRYLMPPAQAILDDPKLTNRNPGSVLAAAMQQGLFADGLINDPAEHAFARQAVSKFGVPALQAEADANLNGWFNGGDTDNRRRSRDILRQLLEQYGLGAPAVAGPPVR